MLGLTCKTGESPRMEPSPEIAFPCTCTPPAFSLSLNPITGSNATSGGSGCPQQQPMTCTGITCTFGASWLGRRSGWAAWQRRGRGAPSTSATPGAATQRRRAGSGWVKNGLARGQRSGLRVRRMPTCTSSPHMPLCTNAAASHYFLRSVTTGCDSTVLVVTST